MLNRSHYKDIRKEIAFQKTFSELVNFLHKNGRFPEISDNEILYRWTASLRNEWKKGLLKAEFVEKLNAIGFIWDKRDYNWRQNYELAERLIRIGEIPTSINYPQLYGWMKTQFQLLESGPLEAEKLGAIIELKNAIKGLKQSLKIGDNTRDTISAKEIKWNQYFNALVDFRNKNPNSFPNANSVDSEESKLGAWCQTLRLYFKQEKLEESWVNRLNSLGFDFEMKVRDAKWDVRFEELMQFREVHPDSWPQVDSESKAEKKLGIWCQDLRSRYKRGILEEKWIEKLLSIGFNLHGRQDNWKERFEKFKEYILSQGQLPGSYHELYNWGRLQYKYFYDLDDEKKSLLDSIGFLDLFKGVSWDSRYKEFNDFLIRNKKLPTRKSNLELYSWFNLQRVKHRMGKLDENERKKLEDLGIDFTPADLKRKDAWNIWYQKLIAFRKENPDRWPSYYGGGDEKKLYIWCQAQRQVQAGTALRRKPLSAERVEKLDKLGFHWTLDEFHEMTWEESFSKLKEFIESNKSNKIPSRIGGQTNLIYVWLHRQKHAMRKNNLSEERIEKLMSLGVL